MPALDDYDHELLEAVEELEASGDLEKGTAAYGIARQVIDDGYDSLTASQRYVYGKHVAPAVAAIYAEWRRNATLNSAPD